MNNWNDWDNRNRDTCDDQADCAWDAIDGVEAMANAMMTDPWDGDHNIEYWVWDGKRLVPATPDEQASIQEMERLASAHRQMAQWTQGQRRGATRIRLLAGMRHTVASVWRFWRHGALPMTLSSQAEPTTTSARQQDGER